jgi:carbon-monoxide dehydrogenase large subunit
MTNPIGQSLRRREDRPLLLGQGQYAADIRLPGLLHLTLVRSIHPHARLDSVSLEAARQLPGVQAFVAADLPEIGGTLGDAAPPGAVAHPRPVLASGRVRYAGEPIAAIVAEDPVAAVDAAQLVEVQVSPLDGVGDVTAATAPGAPLLHEGMASNVAGRVERGFGDAEAAFDGAPVVVRQRFQLGRVAGGYLEPRASVASFDPASRVLTLWTSTQWVYGVRDRIAALLGLERDSVRVLAPDVGGGFGAKGMVYPEEVLVAALALRLGRPVRWVATRTEDTAATTHSHGTVVEAELAAESDGTLRGLRARLWHDVGAYAAPGMLQSDNILSHLVSAYRLPALRAEVELVYTNAVPSGYIRGGGREVGNFVVERLMDRLAAELRLAPVEVRRRNLIGPEQMPHATGYVRPPDRPTVYDGGDYPRLLDAALEAIDYSGARRQQAAGARIGVGVACCVEQAGIGLPEPARIRVAPDGTVQAFLGSTPQGQGHRTVFAQVVAERLGWPIERIEIFAGDSTAVSSAANTAGSRSALEVGNAAAAAAVSARRQLLERARALLEAAADDVELGPSGAVVRGAPARGVTLAQLLGGQDFEAEETFHSRGTYTAACHAAVVELDPDTAHVRILRYAIAHDCGRAINPLLVEGQILGGLVHGLGYALLEEAAYLPDGTFASASFLDYALPGPRLLSTAPALVHHEAPIFGNPEGFKGVGETGTISAPAAVIGAIEDSLRRHGVDTTLGTIPLTATRLFALLAKSA